MLNAYNTLDGALAVAVRSGRNYNAALCPMFLEIIMADGINGRGWIRGRLDNGLRYILVPNPAFHSVVFTLDVKVGGRHERDGTFGLSHYLEHMLFHGVKPYTTPSELNIALAGMGGSANAVTTQEFTSFTITTHSDFPREGVEIIRKLVFDCSFTEEQVESERSVILQELARSRGLGAKSHSLHDLAYNMMWRPAALHTTVMGDKPHVAGFNLKALRERHERYFRPDNAVLCVAGGFDPVRVEAMVREQFSGLNGKAEVETPELVTVQNNPGVVLVAESWPVVYLMVCHRACASTDPKHRALLLAADMLGGGPHSRLFVRFREELGLTYDISASPALYSDVGSLDIQTSTHPKRLEELLCGIMADLRKLAGEGFQEKEMEQCAALIRYHTDFLLDNPYELAEWFGRMELLLNPGRLVPPEEERDFLLAVTLDEVNVLVADVLRPERFNLAAIGPMGFIRSGRIRRMIHSL